MLHKKDRNVGSGLWAGSGSWRILIYPYFSRIEDMQQLSKRIVGLSSLVILAGLQFVTTSVGAQAMQTYDQVDLSASAAKEIENDLLVAVVYAQAQNARQSVAANEVNEAIAWALEQADDVRGVTTQTLQYSSFPQYSSGQRITGWQARQSLRLQSSDTDALSELLGELQSRVAIESVNYDVSRATRDAANDELIAEALAQFNRRASLIAQELGRSGYRIVRINISTSGDNGRPVMYRSRGAEMMDAAVAAPALDAGVQSVVVNVSGSVELDPLR